MVAVIKSAGAKRRLFSPCIYEYDHHLHLIVVTKLQGVVLYFYNMSDGKTKISTYTVHNRVKLVRGGSEYFDLLEKMINEARFTIHLHTYLYDEDETGMRIATALINAVKRNVNVYLLADGYASGGLSPDFKNKLRTGGVHFSFFEPFVRSQHFYMGRRLHYKVVVVDSFCSLVGGINISNKYNDMPGLPAWLDWAVYTEGEASVLLENHCAEIWNGSEKRERYIAVPLISITRLKEICIVKTRKNDWVNRKTEIYQSYMELFSTAHSDVILMSSYFWPGRRLLNRIMDAAKRGVKVKLILAGVSDIKLAKYAERYIYRRLLKNGIEIYEYQGNVLHGKVAVFDGREVTIGSFNVNNISAYASVELNLVVKNEAFAGTVNSALSDIITSNCFQITEELFVNNYNLFQRLWHQLSYEIVHFIFFLFTFYFRQSDLKG